MAPYRCPPPCRKTFHDSRGLNLHISRTKTCRQRQKALARSTIRDWKKWPNRSQRSRSSSLDDCSVAPLPDGADAPQTPPANSPLSSNAHQSPARSIYEGVNQEVGEEVHPEAGYILGMDNGTYEKVAHDHRIRNNRYWPFIHRKDWELASWIATSGLSQTKIDSFFKLSPIKQLGLSYGSAVTLKSRIETLPSNLSWKSIEIIPETESHLPLEPLVMYWREPLDCIAELLANPRLNEGMDFAPRKVYADASKQNRLYNEMATGGWWWRMQEKLQDPSGTIIPVILASDKTHLTTMVGDKEAWPFYISIGNITQYIRNKANEHAFLLSAYLPIPKFGECQGTDGVLRDRIYHQCVEFLLKRVAHCGKHGRDLSDAHGNVRHCFTLLAAHVADLPEQQIIAIAPHSHSPVTRISKKQFGSSEIGRPRSRQYVLKLLEKAKRSAHPYKQLRKYVAHSKFHGLSGVDRPFWAMHSHADPNVFLTPDHLHQVHKFFRDHIVKWVKYVVGAEELDFRLKVLQPVRNFKHWKNGISKLKQWTGREDRELERTILAVAAGGGKMNATAVKNLRAALDFIYLSQYASHCDDTLKYLTDALEKFHKTKNVWIRLGGRRGKRGVIQHFNIPKLPSWSNFAQSIREMGSALQYSSDTFEHGHVWHVKQPHARSNKRAPTEQMCRDLDRLEKVAAKNAYISYCDDGVQPAEDQDRQAKLPVKQFPLLDTQETEGWRQGVFSTSVSLALKPKLSNWPLEEISTLYELPDFRTAVEAFCIQSKVNTGQMVVPFTTADVWHQFRLHLTTVQKPRRDLPPKTVQALPPNDVMPFGRCNPVLVRDIAEKDEDDDGNIQAFSVVQIRCIFKPTGYSVDDTLAYVQLFSKPAASPEANIEMYVVERKLKKGKPVGVIIALHSVARMIQLIPKFGRHANRDLNCDNVLDTGAKYYINSFWDKEIYQAVY